MTIHKEGYPTIIYSFLLLVVINTVLHLLTSDALVLLWVAGSISVVLWLLIVQFFRKPNRRVQGTSNEVYSPADGKIVAIEKTMENEYSQEERIQVSIFMSIFNVHMNLYPCRGSVTYVKYHPGRFFFAHLPKSSELNERNSVAMETPSGKHFLMRQIAGGLARRIVCYASSGQKVEAGDEMGFIKFGSRVDLFLPTDAEIQVQLNQKVRAGKDLIARI